MQLNCKVIKSGNPHFYINPTPPSFQSDLPFLAKVLVPPKWLNFWKVLPPLPPPPPFSPLIRSGGGSNFEKRMQSERVMWFIEKNVYGMAYLERTLKK